MCNVTVTTNHLCTWFTCEDCNVTLQNPVPPYPVEWLNNHAVQPLRALDEWDAPSELELSNDEIDPEYEVWANL